uniref:Golgin subfamily A member 5 n=1 Tax=Pavo cristatus TaxID=9049 RepID=A0A8C9L6H0_PAVCR
MNVEVCSELVTSQLAVEAGQMNKSDYHLIIESNCIQYIYSKEKLINSLKEGSGIEGLDSQTANTMELEELRHERDTQREEIQKLMGQIQQMRTELQDIETQQVSEAESVREQLQDLQEQIAAHKMAKQEAEAELERQKQELRYTEEELYRTKNTLQSRIKDREEEIQKLRNQTATPSGFTLMSFFVSSLQIGARMRNVPVLFSDVDTNVAGMYGRVRKAASSIDQFSIRLGIFLRRYPIARIFVIIYMALLHLWVMIVLLTYTPEMHHDSPSGR